MARLSRAGEPSTREERARGEDEESSAREEGSLSGSARIRDSRELVTSQPHAIAHGYTPNVGAMGQTESQLEKLQRNTAIHRAARLAGQSQPKKRGSLPSRSTRTPLGAPGQRRLQKNVLSKPDVYDPPDDEDEAPPTKRHVEPERPFSPLKRHAHQPSRSLEEAWRSDQQQIDEQLQAGEHLNEAMDVEDEEAEEENIVAVNGEHAHDYGASQEKQVPSPNTETGAENVSRYRDFFPDSLVRQAQASQSAREDAAKDSTESNIGGALSRLATGNQSSRRNDSAKSRDIDSGQDRNNAIPQAQQSTALKRKRGRPSKNAANESTGAQVAQQNSAPKRKRGRPSKEAPEQPTKAQPVRDHFAAADKEQRATLDQSDNQGNMSPDQLASRSSPPVQKSASVRSRMQTRSKGRDSSLNGTVTAEEPPDTRPFDLQQVEHAQTEHLNFNVGQDLQDGANAGEDDQTDYRREEQNADDDDDDTGRHADGSGVDHNDGQDDNDNEADNTDAEEEHDSDDQETISRNSHRLYGHWNDLRRILSSVAEHGGGKVHIRDEAFKQVLEDCRAATRLTRALVADAFPQSLDECFVLCKLAVKKSQDVCRIHTSSGVTEKEISRQKKKGFHIFKHLIPALVKLLKAVLSAYERVDVHGAGLQQINLPHLCNVVKLMRAITVCEERAYKDYQDLGKAIKQKVHQDIAVPLRTLCTILDKIHRSAVSAQQTKEEEEWLEQEIEARDHEREQLESRSRIINATRSKWQLLNNERIIVANTHDSRKLKYLRSCPSKMIELDANGEAFLPDEAHSQQGHWSMVELDTLHRALRKYADPEPVSSLHSMVFEKVIRAHCTPRGELADKNVLQIVVTANDLSEQLIQSRFERGEEVESWMERVPRWIKPVFSGTAGVQGGTAAGAIELD